MKWNDELGGLEELDAATRDDINDWAQKNNLGWGSPSSKLIQEGVVVSALAIGRTFAEEWLVLKEAIKPSDILQKVAIDKMGRADP